MKKTYIEPKNTVVRINMETMIAQSDPSPAALDKGSTIANQSEIGARETIINTPDAWEEW